MRYPAAEKLAIIRLVEQSPVPVRHTLAKLGIPRAIFYRWYDRYSAGGPEALPVSRGNSPFYRRAGLPTAVTAAGTSRVTTLPAPISALSPILTPGRIIAPPPIHTLRPMRIGRPNSNPEALLTASRE